MAVNIPKDQNMQTLAKWLKVDPRWLWYGDGDSFVTDYVSLSEEATVRAVGGCLGGGSTEPIPVNIEE